jgi:hypothetical protein
MANDISGTVNPESGSGELNINLKTFVLIGGTITRPCTVCVGDTTPQDGIKDGHCSGGVIPCDVDGFDATFAPQDVNEGLSLDCKTTTNISGAGLKINLTFTTGHSELAFENKCDSPLDLLDCACGVCTGDTSLACRNDAECATAGVGTCTTYGGGAAKKRQPNSCSDNTCTDIGQALGRCNAGAGGDSTTFCDGSDGPVVKDSFSATTRETATVPIATTRTRSP